MSTARIPARGRAAEPTPQRLGLAADQAAAEPGDPAAAHLRVAVDGLLRTLLAYEAGVGSGHDPSDHPATAQRAQAVRATARSAHRGRACGTRLARGATRRRTRPRRADPRVREIAAEFGGFEGFAARDRGVAGELLSALVAERGTARGRLTKALPSARYAGLVRSLPKLTERDTATRSGRGAAPLGTQAVSSIR